MKDDSKMARHELVARITELEKQLETSWVPPNLTLEMRKMLLDVLWPGKDDTPEGVPNTLWALVKAACDNIAEWKPMLKELGELQFVLEKLYADTDDPPKSAIGALQKLIAERNHALAEVARLNPPRDFDVGPRG